MSFSRRKVAGLKTVAPHGFERLANLGCFEVFPVVRHFVF
jgi:hypothetical protein